MRNARTCFLLCIVSLPVALGTAQTTAPARRSKPASKPATPEKPTKEALNVRSEEHTSELQSLRHLVCRLLLEKKKKKNKNHTNTIRSKNKRLREHDKEMT